MGNKSPLIFILHMCMYTILDFYLIFNKKKICFYQEYYYVTESGDWVRMASEGTEFFMSMEF